MKLALPSTRPTKLTLFFILLPLVAGRKAVPSLFIFGDSFFDAGNNNYINTTTLDQANFYPYGQTYFNFPTGRFSDGRLITDFISEYAKVPLIAPYLQPGNDFDENGVNFASAGAGALVETFRGSVIDLKTQLWNFMKVKARLRDKLGDVESKKKLSNAVYLFSIGTNDYNSIFLTNSTALASFSHQQYINMVIGNLTTVIKAIYESGGRKFGFINLGDLGCLPIMRLIKPHGRGHCLGEASFLAKLHNEALSISLLKMVDQFPAFKYSLYDFYSALKLRMNIPSQFGLKEGKIACCGTGRFRGILSCGGKRVVKEFELCENPNKYVFWDSIHLTEEVYKQMAAEIWNGSPHNIGPYNLMKLVECF